MKKLVLCIALAILGFINLNAQAFKLGANVGLPVGDAKDVSVYNIGVDVNVLWEVSQDFSAGLGAGFTNHFLQSQWKDFGIKDVQFLPIAAVGRFYATEKFKIGADLGYAIGLDDGNDGGFYYRPMVGFDVTNKIEFNLSYSGISVDGGTWSVISYGVMFEF